MSVRILSGDDVRTALTMPDCIEAMDAVLQAARRRRALPAAALRRATAQVARA